MGGRHTQTHKCLATCLMPLRWGTWKERLQRGKHTQSKMGPGTLLTSTQTLSKHWRGAENASGRPGQVMCQGETPRRCRRRTGVRAGGVRRGDARRDDVGVQTNVEAMSVEMTSSNSNGGGQLFARPGLMEHVSYTPLLMGEVNQARQLE